MFLANLNTMGNEKIIAKIIIIKATFKPAPNIKKETRKAATPMATFKP